MILYFLITCIPFFLFIKSLLISQNLKTLPSWAKTAETRLLSPSPPLSLFKDLTFSILFDPNPPNQNDMSFKRKLRAPPPPPMTTTTTTTSSKVGTFDDETTPSPLLDLPELALDCILEKLPPKALRSMAGVCRPMRERCSSDRFWEKLMKRKWGRVISEAAFRDWQWHVNVASNSDFGESNNEERNKKKKSDNNKPIKGLVIRILSLGWPFSWIVRPNDDGDIGDDHYDLSDDHDDHDDDDAYNMSNNFATPYFSSNQKRSSKYLGVDSIMARYLALETGKFCFPAQVYNRENGHVGFMLSCYDAQISYDPRTDTFEARYPPHGRRAMGVESGVPWERVRAPPVKTHPHELHISDCLHELRPGNHFEIQWRRNKDFPYGWWYGVVGHLESCDGNEYYCRCHDSETVVLEFNQYTAGSRWRHMMVNRKDHREEGNEADGFYGGIRKLGTDHEISAWKHLWPAETLD